MARGICEVVSAQRSLTVVDVPCPASTVTVDVVLVDAVDHVPSTALPACSGVRADGPRYVVMGIESGVHLVARALESGARGYLDIRMSGTDLVDALLRVHAGEIVVTARVPQQVSPPGAEAVLSYREAEIVGWIAQGLNNAEIAKSSGLSINSVKSYIRAAYRKMGVTSRTHAVLWGIRNGLGADEALVRTESAVGPTVSSLRVGE
ncbi:MAG: response regulator transcription factor [Nocardioides sp.]